MLNGHANCQIVSRYGEVDESMSFSYPPLIFFRAIDQKTPIKFPSEIITFFITKIFYYYSSFSVRRLFPNLTLRTLSHIFLTTKHTHPSNKIFQPIGFKSKGSNQEERFGRVDGIIDYIWKFKS